MKTESQSSSRTRELLFDAKTQVLKREASKGALRCRDHCAFAPPPCRRTVHAARGALGPERRDPPLLALLTPFPCGTGPMTFSKI